MTRRVPGLVALFVVLGAVAGCATEGPRHDVTHQWVPGDRIARVNFDNYESECRAEADTVSGYEACMSARGYDLEMP